MKNVSEHDEEGTRVDAENALQYAMRTYLTCFLYDLGGSMKTIAILIVSMMAPRETMVSQLRCRSHVWRRKWHRPAR
jgi:hypothetical protein